MENLKNVKEKVVNKVIQYKARFEVFLITLLALFGTSTCAYASINGENIKNNVINNFLIPFCLIIICALFIKELMKKNIAGLVILGLIGGAVLVILYKPDIIKLLGDTVMSILGIG